MAEGKFQCSNQNEGCSILLKCQSDLEQHAILCKYGPVICPQSCSMKVLRKDILSHLSTECPLRPVSCPHCGDDLCQKQLKEHEATCKHNLVTCDFCSALNIPANELEEHFKICELKPRDCPMNTFGCTFQGPKNEIEKHHQDIGLHFFPLVEVVKELRASLDEKNGDLEKQKREKLAIKAKLKSLETAQQQHLKEIEEAKALPKELIKEIERISKETRDLGLLLKTFLPRQENFEKRIEEKVLYEMGKQRSLHKEIEAAVSSAPKPPQGGRFLDSDPSQNGWDPLQPRACEAIPKPGDFDEESLDESSDVSNNAVSTKRKTKKPKDIIWLNGYNPLKPSNFKSTVDITKDNLWRVCCYGQIRKEKTATFVWSRKLYTTGNPGYYFAFGLRVNKSGNAPKVGVFISLYKGPHDDLLTWPFPYTVHIKILRNSNMITDDKPYATELCSISHKTTGKDQKYLFGKPTEPRNKPVGRYSVILLSELEDPANGYINDDNVDFQVYI